MNPFTRRVVRFC